MTLNNTEWSFCVKVCVGVGISRVSVFWISE